MWYVKKNLVYITKFLPASIYGLASTKGKIREKHADLLWILYIFKLCSSEKIGEYNRYKVTEEPLASSM